MKRSFAKTMPVLNVTGSEFIKENFTNWMKQCTCGKQNDGLHASNGWLESFKTTYVRRKATSVISGEAGDVLITTVKA